MGSAGVREADIQRSGVRWLKSQFCLPIKLTTYGQYGTRGWPDYLVVELGGWSWFCEFKRPGAELTPLQSKRITELRRQGCFVGIVHSQKELERARECALLFRGDR